MACCHSGATSVLVVESLANCRYLRAIAPLRFIYAVCNPFAVPKINLHRVAVQVLLAAVLGHALHAKPEGTLVAFDRVCMDLAAAIPGHWPDDAFPMGEGWTRLFDSI